jgi:hypothetical protein
MKVKLLKKIRKRYDMTHYPNGVFISNKFYNGPITILTDNNNSFRFQLKIDLPPNLAYKELYPRLISWIESDYGPFKSSKQRKITSEKIWYKN